MCEIPSAYQYEMENITDLLEAIKMNSSDCSLIKLLKEHLDELIEKIDNEDVKSKIKLIRKKVVLIEKNLDIVSDRFFEETYYLLSYIRKCNKKAVS
ncbi:MAG: hypothetical protein JG768_1540 [Fusobacteriales bacterium]|jgi:hypothetical protein|nr:hypothetical protein [Fusobacteriales bacterium]